MKSLRYLFFLIIPAAVYFSLFSTGWLTFSALATAFGILPLVELFLQPKDENLDLDFEKKLRNQKIFDFWLYINIPIVFGAIFIYLNHIQSEPLHTYELVGKTSAIGILLGVNGINVAHELGHRKEKFHQVMAQILLLSSMYTHFYIEHNKGHHLNVSTPEDPSSARYKESIYHFWWRSVSQTYISAWKLAGKHMLALQIIQIIWVLILYKIYDIYVALYLAAAVIGFLLLESVNYIEHYGLRRKSITPTLYEKAKPEHSWNSNHPIGRLVLFELSRHSDHHYQPQRPYQILKHHKESPQLPTGYPGMILLAFVPPIFFNVMDKQMRNFGLLKF